MRIRIFWLLKVLVIASTIHSVLAQGPLVVNQTRYRARAGERVRIQAPAETVGFVRGAKRVTSRFAVATTASGDQVILGVPFRTVPGEYTVPIEVVSATGELRAATVQVTVDAAVTVPSSSTAPPVILLDGWQAPSSASPCPITSDSTGTFGNLASYLTATPNQVPVVYFFENCTECPDCAIEDLGADLGAFINSIHYDNGTAVPQVDVIAHSMGGLIVRSYLAGKQKTPGTFTPPAVTKVRKAVFLATPHFGAYQADSPLAAAIFGTGVQVSDMKRGSQFLWDLATWNQFGDDLRGVDAVSVVGNGAISSSPPVASDGVVGMSSASLGFAAADGRTLVEKYCHVPLTPGLEATLLGCTGGGIAYIDTPNHFSYQIIQSFLAGTAVWQTLGIPPSQTAPLNAEGGVLVAARSAKDQDLNDVSAAALGATQLTAGPTNAATSVYYDDLLAPGTYAATLASAAGGTIGGTVTAGAGGYRAAVVKPGPSISSVRSAVGTGVAGVTVAAGQSITIVGAGFDASSVVTVAGLTLAISAMMPQQITAFLPATVSGYVTLTVTTSGGQAGIRMMVAPASNAAPAIVLSSTVLQFSYLLGGTAPGPQTVGVTNGGGGTLVWSATSSAAWLTVANAPNAVVVSVNVTGLAAGLYNGTVTVTATGAANSPQTISVTLLVSPSVTAITNAASGAMGAIAPGEIVTIWGYGLGPAQGVGFTLNTQGGVDTTLGGMQVIIGGAVAPLLYVSATQINAIVPYEAQGFNTILPGGGPTQSQILVMIRVANTFLVNTFAEASAAPGIFTANGGGTGQILAANQDGSANGAGNPAAKGSYVTMYFTGGGQTSPAGTTGGVNGTALKQLVQPVSVTVGGQPATVTFAGAAPGMVDGVCQLNILLANDAASGAAQPVVVTVGGVASPATGTIAVQ